jgi:SAM-dependent methyltransferase
MSDEVERREREHWDHHVPPLEQCVAAFQRGPDANTAAMINAVGPRPGLRVLDFACGAGLTSAWLASSGANVLGVDVSPASIARAEELRQELGLKYELRVVGLGVRPSEPSESFEALVGRFALHHVDLEVYAPLLAETLESGGIAAFLENMLTNPLLRVARSRLPGRAGIARYGTDDEHPLKRSDLSLLERTFGSLEVRVPGMVLFRLLDRHIFFSRSPRTSRVLDAMDRTTQRFSSLDFLSYEQLLVLRRPVPDRVA